MKARDRTPGKPAPRGATAGSAEPIDSLRAQHFDRSTRQIMTEDGVASVLLNDSESPLARLARRKCRDGRGMVSPHQFVAGEKLPADFTRADLLPRVTSNWSAAGARVVAAAPAR
jgi:hypothetical protein